MSPAPAVDISGAGSPFGAAHRVYLDTPPLTGRCGALWGALELLVCFQKVAFVGAL